MPVSTVGDGGSESPGLATVLDLVRSGIAVTRPEISRLSGLGRKAVALRVEQLIACGLLSEGRFGRSTGGRLPRELQFEERAGLLAVAELGATVISVGLTDLCGRLVQEHTEPADTLAGAETTLARVEEMFRKLLAATADELAAPLWGIGIGVLGPVDAASGRPVPLSFLPGWGDYPVRDRLEAAFGVPVWVDNEVNLMALGEFRQGGSRTPDMIYVKMGSGTKAGIISGGRLIHGVGGAAGEIGHISVSDDPAFACACGNVGCLNEFTGSQRLAAAGREAARSGRSASLREVHEAKGDLDAKDVARAAALGDRAAVEILNRAADKVGRVLAVLVNVHNPSLILIGGTVAAAGDSFLSAIRQAMYPRAFPSSVRDLRVSFSPLSDRAGLVGAAFLALDQLLGPAALPVWIDSHSPAGHTAADLRSAVPETRKDLP
jgi:glucokinase-like ROK family protein